MKLFVVLSLSTYECHFLGVLTFEIYIVLTGEENGCRLTKDFSRGIAEFCRSTVDFFSCLTLAYKFEK